MLRLVAGATLLTLAACAKPDPKPPVSNDAVPVRVRSLAPEPYQVEKTFVGDVRPWREFHLSFQLGGPINAFFCEKGDRVTSGQALAQIDERDARFDLRDAMACVAELEQLTSKTRSLTRPQALAALKARCRQCDANLRKAQLEYERAKQLLADNVTPKSQFDQIEAAYQAALAEQTVSREELKLAEEGARIEEIRAVEAQLERARVAVERARKRLDDTRLLAPAHALVVRRFHEPGETARPGEPIVDLVEIDRVKVLLRVAEQDVVRLAKDQEVSIVADAVADRRVPGYIHYISDVADSLLRTFDVEVAVPNADFVLKPGMVARVTVVLNKIERALVVAETSVVERDGVKGFFYLDGQTAAFFPLDKARRDGTRYVVQAPNPPIGPLIETRSSRLAPGTRVQVVASQDTAP